MKSTILALLVGTVVATGCANTGPRAGDEAARSGDSVASDPSPRGDASAADVARVVCEKHRAILQDPVVRAQRDGVHVAVENDGVWGFEFRSTSDPHTASNSGRIGSGTTRLTAALGPGDVLVACLRARDPDVQGNQYHDEDAPTATLTVVDPDGLFVPWDLSCGFGEQFRMDITAGEDENPASVLRRVPGVLPADEVKRPKYPDSPRYYAMEFVVFRDGQAVARVMGPYYEGTWHLLINACPGSGIHK